MPTSGTEDLVKDVLDNIQAAAAAGDGTAIADLTKRSGSKAAAAKPPKPEPPSLTVPEKVIDRPNGEGYHVRKIGPHDDVALLRHARTKKLNVLLTGLPGTGKTALIEAAFCSDPGSPGVVYTVQGTGDTMTDDFVGGYWQDGDGKYHWADGPMILACEEGRPLYIDEIALIDPKVLALVYGLMDGRDEIRITQNPDRGVIKAQPGFYVVAACNPNAPGARMSEALTSRFKIQPEVTTDFNLARELGVDAKLLIAANNLETKRKEGGVGWSPQMRELLAFKEIAEEFGMEVAARNLISQAPEMDRKRVKEILSRQLAKNFEPLTVV